MRSLFGVFLSLESPAAFVMLLWGNVSLSTLVFSYLITSKVVENRRTILNFTLSRIIQAFGWGFLVVFEMKMSRFSLMLGLSICSIGLFWESQALLSLAKLPLRRKRHVRFLSLALFLFSFLIFLWGSVGASGLAGVPVQFWALFGCLGSFLGGPAALARPGTTQIRKFVGICALVMFAALAGWLYQALTEDSGSFHLFWEDSFRIVAVILALTGGSGMLILAKEDSDLRIADMAVRDHLTGLYNRRHFLDNALMLYADCVRKGEPVSVLFLDLDHFKAVNDRYGHLFGDAVLRDFSTLLRLSLRPLDLPCRYGGEEFVVLLPRTDAEGALSAAERLLEAVRNSKFPERMEFSYTVSAGIAWQIPASGREEDLMALLSDADGALYRAKTSGRDRVVTAEIGS